MQTLTSQFLPRSVSKFLLVLRLGIPMLTDLGRSSPPLPGQHGCTKICHENKMKLKMSVFFQAFQALELRALKFVPNLKYRWTQF